jgi:hypothetical protein
LTKGQQTLTDEEQPPHPIFLGIDEGTCEENKEEEEEKMSNSTLFIGCIQLNVLTNSCSLKIELIQTSNNS